MKRIGLTQRVVEVSGYGERRDALDQAWTRLIEALGWLAVPLPNAATDAAALVRELGLAGVILTGGNDVATAPGADDLAPERDRLEHALVEACAAAGVPVLGVCRGAQLLATHYGSALERRAGHAGTRHQLVVMPGVLDPLAGPLDVNSYHDYVLPVAGLGADLLVAAEASDGSVEAYRHRTLPQAGILWHPEREQPFAATDLALLTRTFGA